MDTPEIESQTELKTRIAEYLKQYPQASAELLYFSSVFDVLTHLNPPINELSGFACMKMLELSEIYLKDGSTINVETDVDLDVMGSHTDLAEVMAVVFADVASDSRYWNSLYPRKLNDPQVAQAADELTEQLRNLSIIDRVVC